MYKIIAISIFICFIITGTFGYDKEKAEYFNTFFSSFSDKVAGKKMQKITPEKMIKRISLGEEFTIIDIRTKAETDLVSVGFKNTLNIPMDQVFTKENLAKIPKDITIVILCKSGSRAVATAMALRQIGFDKTHILAGGIIALTTYLCPSKAQF